MDINKDYKFIAEFLDGRTTYMLMAKRLVVYSNREYPDDMEVTEDGHTAEFPMLVVWKIKEYIGHFSNAISYHYDYIRHEIHPCLFDHEEEEPRHLTEPCIMWTSGSFNDKDKFMITQDGRLWEQVAIEPIVNSIKSLMRLVEDEEE